MPAHFTPETFRFLRGLIKNNDRAWFEERRPVYERAVKTPLLALIDEINQHLADFAPEHIRPPHKVAMRIYRDTRFSPDKRPYKRHLSAWWAREGLQKTSAGGFYLQIGPEGGFVAAGIYTPERDDLLRVRRWMAEHHERYREALAPLLHASSKAAGLDGLDGMDGMDAMNAMEPLEPNALTRNPKGFPADHPAGDLLRARNWGVTLPMSPQGALDPSFAAEIAASFRRAAPFLYLLNEPFLQGRSSAAPSVFPL